METYRQFKKKYDQEIEQSNYNQSMFYLLISLIILIVITNLLCRV